jgi:hypothetical protein
MRNLLFILSFFVLNLAKGQEVSAHLSIDRILVGQPDTLTIVILSPTEKVILPQFLDTLSTSLEVIETGDVDSSLYDYGFTFTQQVYFTSFDTGKFVVPQLSFQSEDSTYFSQDLFVTVTNVQIDLAKNIHGIQDIEDAPITMREVLIVVGKTLLLLSVILLIVWVFKRLYVKYKLSKESVVDLEPEIPFMDTFWDRLSAIEEGKFWQKGEVKKFHSQVTSLMRSYLEYRYGINALEQTSDEILTQLQILVQDKILFAKIEQTLRFADMVKFAKAVGVQGQHEKAIDNLKELVQLTDFKSTEESE